MLEHQRGVGRREFQASVQNGPGRAELAVVGKEGGKLLIDP